MKPLHQSRKAWIAIITLALNGIVVLATERAGRPDLQALGLQIVTLLGGILIAAFGAADHGKEASMARDARWAPLLREKAEAEVVPDDDEEVDE